jgi:hypothetical protein
MKLLLHTALLLVLLSPFCLHAQDGASLSGVVMDASQYPLSGVSIRLSSAALRITRQAVTARNGGFAFDQIPPGTYILECQRVGFAPLQIPSLELHSREVRSLSLELSASAAATSVTRVDRWNQGIAVGPSSPTSLSGASVRSLPLTNRGVIQLLPLAAGVVSGSVSTAGPDASPSRLYVNGLRWNLNHLLVDGVSTLGASTFSAVVASRGIGAAEASVSMDSLEELTIETSPLTAVYGRGAGVQVMVRSRAGLNDTHGSAFGFLRNSAFAANDWLSNAAGVAAAPLRHRQFGGTLGGALRRNRTFYFLSYEDLFVRMPHASVLAVPDTETRAKADLALRPYLNAFPAPNGSTLGNGAARFTSSSNAESQARPFSARLDHRPTDSLSLFLRHSESSGERHSRGSGWQSPAVLTDLHSKNRQTTGALLWSPNARITNDLRGTYGRTSVSSRLSMDDYAGASPLYLSAMLPEGVSVDDASFQFHVLGLGSFGAGKGPDARQEQVQIVDTLSLTQRDHSFHLGFDYRRLFSTLFPASYAVQATFGALQGANGSLLSGVASGAVVARNEPRVEPVASSTSFFAQDSWRVTERLHLLYGLRWDWNPAPSTRSGPAMVLYDGASGVTRFGSLYATRKADIAPRIALAYRLDTTSGRELVFRAGGGVFYEPGYGNLSEYFSGAPYSSQRILSLVPFPLSAANRAAPGLPSERPYGQVNGADPFLSSPRILQWNVALEKHLGHGQSLRVGYAGTSGRQLLTSESQPAFNKTYTLLRVVSNSGESDYRGLQLSYRQSSWHGLTALASYTWSRAIDTASEDHGAALPALATTFGQERGDSDFDARHTLATAGSYAIPSLGSKQLERILRDWHVEWLLTARSALPFDVQTITSKTSETKGTQAEGKPGLFALVRANYLGQPVWVKDASAPGGKRLNPAAFTVPADFKQGTLGRNSLRGFGLWQADLSLRRDFDLGEHAKLQLLAQALNAFNCTNFANPSLLQGAYLGSALFGASNTLAGSALGGGLSPLYGQGGPRTIQIGLRLVF